MGDKEELELRYVLEEVLSHVARGDRLIFDSFQRRPSSVSCAATKRAPRKPASSVGCR